MNKSEIELENVQSIISQMPVAERALCTSMIASLMASVGHPVHGRVFMIAVAYTNCQVAAHNIKMGLVNEDGSEPAEFMQGDGRANVTPITKAEDEQDAALIAKRLNDGKPLIPLDDMIKLYSSKDSKTKLSVVPCETIKGKIEDIDLDDGK